MQLKKLESPDLGIEMWSFPGAINDSNETSGALVKMNGGPANGHGVIVYFICKDCATESGRVASNGDVVTEQKFALGKYGNAALINDTEDNVVGLHSMQ